MSSKTTSLKNEEKKIKVNPRAWNCRVTLEEKMQIIIYFGEARATSEIVRSTERRTATISHIRGGKLQTIK